MGYDTEIKDFDITNTLITTEVSGIKTWDDKDNLWELRPESITVNLLANGSVIESRKVTEEDNWEYSFKNLPKYDINGIEIKYSVFEDEVKNYTSIVEGYNIINKLNEPQKPEMYNSLGGPMISNKELFYTPKTGNENFIGYFIITAIISAIGIIIIKRNDN